MADANVTLSVSCHGVRVRVIVRVRLGLGLASWKQIDSGGVRGQRAGDREQ